MALKVLILCVLATFVAAAPVEDDPEIHMIHGVPVEEAAHELESTNPDDNPHDGIHVVDGTPEDGFEVKAPEYHHKLVQEMESDLKPPESLPNIPILHDDKPDFHLDDYTSYIPKLPIEHEPVPQIPKLHQIPHGIPPMPSFGMPTPVIVSPIQFKNPEHEGEPGEQQKNHHAETWIHSITYRKEGYHH